MYQNALDYLKKNKSDSYFVPEEWPVPEDLKYVQYEVIFNLDLTRQAFGKPVYPSGNPDGLVRRIGSSNSRHYIGGGLMGRAVDVFPSENVMDFWICAIENSAWQGIGVYLDTKVNRRQPQPMVHLDIDRRSHGNRVFWVRDRGEYIYKHEKPELFWELIAQASKR